VVVAWRRDNVDCVDPVRVLRLCSRAVREQTLRVCGYRLRPAASRTALARDDYPADEGVHHCYADFWRA
jgi:hypothetical protein